MKIFPTKNDTFNETTKPREQKEAREDVEREQTLYSLSLS